MCKMVQQRAGDRQKEIREAIKIHAKRVEHRNVIQRSTRKRKRIRKVVQRKEITKIKNKCRKKEKRNFL